ncbi:MAG TPA: hypothetical protein VHG33_12745 [Woeseiaceae bacterium]|nr:hypothetical protein [Woeseiaceae bacterium]
MTERRPEPDEEPPLIMDETPEQAARSISAALEFLSLEADSIGMLDVSALLKWARLKANDFRSCNNE